jgi:hypothetical protein
MKIYLLNEQKRPMGKSPPPCSIILSTIWYCSWPRNFRPGNSDLIFHFLLLDMVLLLYLICKFILNLSDQYTVLVSILLKCFFLVIVLAIVPQRFTSEPLLFNIFINKVCSKIKHCSESLGLWILSIVCNSK